MPICLLHNNCLVFIYLFIYAFIYLFVIIYNSYLILLIKLLPLHNGSLKQQWFLLNTHLETTTNLLVDKPVLCSILTAWLKNLWLGSGWPSRHPAVHHSSALPPPLTPASEFSGLAELQLEYFSPFCWSYGCFHFPFFSRWEFNMLQLPATDWTQEWCLPQLH